MKSSITVKNWLKSVNNDNIIKILQNNSHLTETQLETLLIHLLSTNFDNNDINIQNIGSYRIKRQVSRGSFNRSLNQAQKNVLKSIYTLLLVGYLDIADSSSIFLRFIEISNKLKEYSEMLKNVSNMDAKELEFFKTIQSELEQILTEYRSIKI